MEKTVRDKELTNITEPTPGQRMLTTTALSLGAMVAAIELEVKAPVQPPRERYPITSVLARVKKSIPKKHKRKALR